jgi:hypothetical protein
MTTTEEVKNDELREIIVETDMKEYETIAKHNTVALEVRRRMVARLVDDIDLSKSMPVLKLSGILTIDKLIPLVKDMMVWLRTFEDMKGEEKKKLIIELLQEFVRKHDAGSLDVLDPLIIQLIPSVIDEFVALNKAGELIFTVRKAKSRVSRWFACCRKSAVHEPQ